MKLVWCLVVVAVVVAICLDSADARRSRAQREAEKAEKERQKEAERAEKERQKEAERAERERQKEDEKAAKEAERAERERQREAERAERDRPNQGGRAEREREKEAEKAEKERQKEAERAERERQKEAEKAEKDRKKEAEKAEKERQKEAEKAEKERQKEAEKGDKEAEKAEKERQKEAERAEKERKKEAEKAEKERQKEAEKAAKEAARADRHADRDARKSQREKEKNERKKARDLKRKSRKQESAEKKKAKSELKAKRNMKRKGGQQCVNTRKRNPVLNIKLECPKVVDVKGATWGVVGGETIDVKDIVTTACHGKRECTLSASEKEFGSIGNSRDKKELCVDYGVVDETFSTCNTEVVEVVDEEKEIEQMICLDQLEALNAQAAETEGGEHDEDVCTCRTWGDPHYDTHDGKRINFQGECIYLISATKDEDDPCYHRVWAKNTRQSPSGHWKTKVSYVDKVWIEFRAEKSTPGLTKVMFQRKSTWPKWLLNGKEKEGSCNSSPGWKLDFNRGHHFTREDKDKDPRCYLSVYFNGGDVLLVKVKKGLGKTDQLYGLCGNCDGVHNDFVNSLGQRPPSCPENYVPEKYGETQCDADIGISYLVDESGDFLPGSEYPQCAAARADLRCDAAGMAVVDSDNFCGYFKKSDGPFADCFKVLDEGEVTQLYESCVVDTCATSEQNSACTALTMLTEACNARDIYPDWRREDFCKMRCTEGSEYKTKMTLAQASCESVAAKICDYGQGEGCQCNTGLLLHKDNCIKPEECNGCLYAERVEMANGEWAMFDGCDFWYICVNGNIMKEESNCKNDENADACEIDNTLATCDCKEGFIRDSIRGFCRPRAVTEEPDEATKERERTKKKNRERRKLRRQRQKARKRKRNCRKRGGKRGGRKNRGKVTKQSTECESESLTECKCTARGDPHYFMFDGGRRDPQGSCSYTISRTIDPSHKCAFHAIGKHHKTTIDARVATTKAVTIEWPEEEGSWTKLHRAKFERRNIYTLNGDLQSIPFQPTAGGVTVERTSYGLIWKMTKGPADNPDCWVEVAFDGKHEVQVKLPKTMGADILGICGNCNDLDDDDLLPSHLNPLQDVSDLERESRDRQVSNYFHVPDPESDINKCTEENNFLPACDPIWARRAMTLEFCAVGQSVDDSNPFKECLEADAIDAEDWLPAWREDCKADVCANKDEPTFETVYCQALENLAHQCAEQGIFVDWRGKLPNPNNDADKFQCVMPCGQNEEYQFDAPGCPGRCGLPEPDECDNPAGDSCVCKEGFVRSNEACVPEATKCGCTEENGAYKMVGETWQFGSCTELRTCENGGAITRNTEFQACTEAHQKCVVNADNSVDCECVTGYKKNAVTQDCEPLVVCGDNEVYKPLVPVKMSQNSCSDQASETVSTPTEAGCKCLDGFIREFPGGRCVHMNEACKCTDAQGTKRNLGDVWRSTDCRHVHKCALVDTEGKAYKLPGVVATVVGCTGTVAEALDANGVPIFEMVTQPNGQVESVAKCEAGTTCDCRAGYLTMGDQCVEMCQATEYKYNPTTKLCDRMHATCTLKYTGEIVTFDGYKFPRQRNCEMTLLKIKSTENCQVTITGELQDGQDYIKKVTMVFEKTDKGKRTEVVYNHGHTCDCQVDGAQTGELGSMNTLGACKGTILHTPSGKICSKMYMGCGVEVCFDGKKSLSINLLQVGDSANPLLGKTEGVCGNSDDEPDNDLVTPDGMALIDYHDSIKHDMFTHAWRTDDSCEKCEAGSDAAALASRDDVCEIYTNSASTPADVKACLDLADEEVTAFAEMQKNQCYHRICKGYESDQLAMFGSVCNFYKRFKDMCANKGVIITTKPYGCTPCVCKASGDPHFTQYDGSNVDVMDKCDFIYSEHTDPADPCYFKITGEHDDAGTGRVSWVGTMKVAFAGGDEIYLGEDQAIEWNGAPYSVLSTPVNPDIKIKKDGDDAIVRYDNCGVKVRFNSFKSIMTIQLNPSLGTKVQGICGNCNEDPTDDLVGLDGTDFSTAAEADELEAQKAFGRTFLELPEGFTDPTECHTEYNGGVCDDLLLAKIGQPDHCGWFEKASTGPFHACVDAMVQSQLGALRANCRLDVCATGGTSEAICKAIENLEAVCEEAGFTGIDWRTEAFCPLTCNSNSEYVSTVTNCEESCGGQDSECEAGVPRPGCKCVAGHVKNPDGQGCILRENCGCVYNGAYFPNGFQFRNSDCSETYECQTGPKIETISSAGCPAGEVCAEVQTGYFDCVPDEQ